MKFRFLCVAAFHAVDGGEIAMRIDHIGAEAQGRFEGDDGAVTLAGAREGYPKIKMREG